MAGYQFQPTQLKRTFPIMLLKTIYFSTSYVQYKNNRECSKALTNLVIENIDMHKIWCFHLQISVYMLYTNLKNVTSKDNVETLIQLSNKFGFEAPKLKFLWTMKICFGFIHNNTTQTHKAQHQSKRLKHTSSWTTFHIIDTSNQYFL